MSLFPAYASEFVQKPSSSTSTHYTDEKKPAVSNVEDPAKESWLDNASFSFQVSQIPLPLNEFPQSLQVESQKDVGLGLGLVPKCETQSEDEGLDEGLPEPTVDNQQKDLPITTPVLEITKRKRSPAEDEKLRHRSKSTKSKKHHHKSSRGNNDEVLPPEVNQDFYTDTKREKGNLTVVSLSRPVVPLYRVRGNYALGLGYLQRVNYNSKRKSSKKKRSKDRYFANFLGQDDGLSRTGAEANPELSAEEELSKQTAVFNRTLGDEPNNVEVWLQYVTFQDTVWQFERMYRRGGGAQGSRVTSERKLAIIDKALTYNPDSEPLLLERGTLAEAVFPADELSQQFATQLEQRPRSMALWRSYINATQLALSLCTVSKVTELYGNAMMRFHQARRGAPASQTRPAEEKILDLLLQCGLFLRQAGLYEQLWTLLHHCLELNVTQPSPDHFKVTSTVSEEKVIETEESVLSSDLPLPELWLRVERLRESVHWLPWVSDEECEDPQRLVFADDVSDLLHPITTPDLSFRLAAIVVTLLKVPALPCRHTSMQSFGVTQIPWALDSVETLIAAVFPFGTVDCGVSDLLSQAADLVTGPSYLSFVGQHPNIGQEHYLDFVTKVFHACGECLKEPARTAWYIWWLRFERFLIILVKNGLCKFPSNRKKKVKNSIKDFLKHDLNRNNLLFYREYALIEKEFGNHDSACNILRTAVSSHQGDKTQLCHLYRTLCELLLTSKEPKLERHSKAVDLLVTLPLGVFQPSVKLPVLKDTNAALVKFRHITDDLVNDLEMVKEGQADGAEHLWPDLLVDWIACHSWLLFLTKSTWEAGALLEDVLTKIVLPLSLRTEHQVVSKTSCQREGLFESYIAVLHQHCQETSGNFSVLNDVLRRALKEFPNNIHFLAAAARVENRESSPWWKLKRLFDDTDTCLSRIFLVLLAKQRQNQVAVPDTNMLSAGCVETVNDDSFKNRLASLFQQLIAHPSTRRCPIVWRFYLKFLFQSSSHEACRSAFYRAVEECPWVKALYIDGAKMLPADIQQVQDLIIEKELRLHVTPEELDILRSKT